MTLTKEEQWILDLFPQAKGHILTPRLLNGLWQNTFPEAGLAPLRAAVAALQEKGIVRVAEGGTLALAERKAEI